VSVMMPCFNSAHTLPLALASLLAQEYENWECMLVDDGSTDEPERSVNLTGDSRIRMSRLDKNRGRGAARQAALEQVRGEYLCMLDADDWMYPCRIRRQVETLEREPRASLVSSAMAVVDDRNEIIGVRATMSQTRGGGALRRFSRVGQPPMSYPASMVRMTVMQGFRYDPDFPTVEDIDMLLTVLLGRDYCILPEPCYGYSEHFRTPLRAITLAHFYVRKAFRKHRNRFPVSSRCEVLKSHLKSIGCRLAFAAGCGKSLIARRTRRPTAGEVECFLQARESVRTVAKSVFASLKI